MKKTVFIISILVVYSQTIAQQKVVFPDSVHDVTIRWKHTNRRKEPVTFRVYSNGNVIASVKNRLFTHVTSGLLGDSSKVWVTASDSLGNESGYPEHVLVVFTSRPIIPPDPIVYEADAAKLWSWGKNGIVDPTKLETQQELRLVGYGVPKGSRGGLNGYLEFEGDLRYEFTVVARGWRLEFSVADQSVTVPLSDRYAPYSIVLDVRKGTHKVEMKTIPGQDVFLKHFRKDQAGPGTKLSKKN